MNADDVVLIACPHCHGLNRVPQARLGEAPNCGRCSQPLITRQPFDLGAAQFDAHASRAQLPLLVDFWASWCGPCRMMAPAFKQAAEALAPHFQLAKVDTDAEAQLAGQFGIRSIPTLILFHHGREIGRQAGALPVGEIVRFARSAFAEYANAED